MMLLLVSVVGFFSLSFVYSVKPPYYEGQEAESPYPPQPYAYQRPPYPPPSQNYKLLKYKKSDSKIPACAKNTTASYCLEDSEYPTQTILEEIYRYYKEFQPLYAEVSDQSTENSVDNLKTPDEETYLCPSSTVYGRPLRAKDVDEKWKIIVNVEKYYQTTRLETCQKPNEPCPLVPSCYESTCVQKYIYRRFVTYDYTITDKNPFKITLYKLPASCSCLVGAFELSEGE